MTNVELLKALREHSRLFGVEWYYTGVNSIWLSDPEEIIAFLEAPDKDAFAQKRSGISQEVWRAYEAMEACNWQCEGITRTGRRCKNNLLNGYGPSIFNFAKGEYKRFCHSHEDQEFDR